MSHPLMSLPQREQIWLGATTLQGDRRRLVWIDEDGQVRCLHHVPAGEEAAEAVWSSLLRAMAEPREGRPLRPEYLLFPDAAVVRALQPRTDELGVRLRVQATPSPSGLPYLAAPKAVVAEFFEAAALFTFEAPWLGWEEDEFLELRGLAPETLYATLLGADEYEPPGLALFHSSGDLLRFLDAGDEAGLVARMSLESPFEAGPLRLAEIAENGWTLVTYDHVPLAWAPGDATEALRLLIRALETVERFVEMPSEDTVVLDDGCRIRVRVRQAALV